MAILDGFLAQMTTQSNKNAGQESRHDQDHDLCVLKCGNLQMSINTFNPKPKPIGMFCYVFVAIVASVLSAHSAGPQVIPRHAPTLMGGSLLPDSGLDSCEDRASTSRIWLQSSQISRTSCETIGKP